MRLVLLTVVAAATIGLAAGNAGARDLRVPHSKPFTKMTAHEKAVWLRKQIHKDRSILRFWRNHRYLEVVGSPVVLEAHTQTHWATVSLRIAKRNLSHLVFASHGGSVPSIICRVFGSYCAQALAVVRCESGFSVNAANGQYLGLFQMGSHERDTYGHGPDAYTQAKAAYAYFVASGRDWSPWSCKP